jgi:branched-chain amino acid transport system permease protein
VIFILIYSILAQSLGFVMGYGGMISLSQAAFFGVGAYTSAILTLHYGLPFLVVVPIVILFGGLVTFISAFITLRNIDDYFMLSSIGIQMILYSLMKNLTSITGGTNGLINIPFIQIWNFKFDSKLSYLFLVIFFTILVMLLLRLIVKSSFGKSLLAISEDEVYSQSLGKDVNKIKLIGFTVGGIIASIAGVLYAHFIRFIEPDSFSLEESIFLLSIIIIGGIRNFWGILIATAFLISLPELLGLVGLQNKLAANIKNIVYGIILIYLIIRYNKNHFTKNNYIKIFKKS